MTEKKTSDAETGAAVGAGAAPSQPPLEVGWRAFPDAALEKLYQSYRAEQKGPGLPCFMFAVALLAVFGAAAGEVWAARIAALVVAVGAVVLARGRGRWAAGAGWALGAAHLVAHLALGGPARAALPWPLVLVYLAFAALPLRLRYCALLAVSTAALYSVAMQICDRDRVDLFLQHISNIILLVSAGLLGLLAFLLDDRQQRQAFLETRQSLEVKLVIEEQSAEQERLLLSVLPEHVAVRMRQDLGSKDTQFKKIYMSRHENVSILYADIVGFTAISSTYSAQDLVAILNELFARFDRLAEKYQQLRIKILGDCYYCISGAPVERPDHAALCIYMGLAMVKSIKYLQETTNSPVDMRVGIHTGAVLAGVLGQRQWQFDVYSRDVELANKMESSGNAGRVHISEKTLSYLNGEFEVEPAFGEKREEALRLAGIKTYFISKVIKPFQPPLDQTKGGATEGDTPDGVILPDVPSDTKAEGDSVKSPIEEEKSASAGREREDSEDFKTRLRKELVSREGHSELAKHTGFLLGFRRGSLEQLYGRRGGEGAGWPLAAAAALPPALLLAALALPPGPYNATPIALGFALCMLAVAAPFLAQHCQSCGKLASMGHKLGSSLVVRILASTIVVLLFSLNNAAQMEACLSSAPELSVECAWMSHCAVRGCAGGALGAAAGALVPLPLLVRAGLAALAAAPPPILAALRMHHALDCWDNTLVPDKDELYIPTKYTLCILMAVIIAALAILVRYMEQTSRVLFLWQTQIEDQRERAADMRQRNLALVYNVLPPHVAAHFMGHRRRQHHELYSQSYAEVGVLFASMPNFAEFYSEETVNNQGLECLRFLNEVISDFDALTELPHFKDIIKIKTIGSSYMAAAGLNPSRVVKPDDPINVRWSHLALLVEFALELKKALQSINEQSFNHFVLKMGINHGPITAGVIGARKPHYDIWGNTVNVASRMESTGKAGCIQVTEETCNILQCFGYKFEQRGLVSVKGKGQLMTYYLIGKGNPEPAPECPAAITGQVMETLKEEDETSPIVETTNGQIKSPNGSSRAACNGSLPLSPLSVRPANGAQGGNNELSNKLLPQEEPSTDVNVNMDARESDALLRH